MKQKRIPWIVACALLSAGIGCHRNRSLSISPGLTAFEQAQAGDTLEWNALNSQTGTFWIVFLGDHPCTEQSIKGDPSHPAKCKIVQPRGLYEYYVSPNPPPPPPPPPPPNNPAGGVPVHCHACVYVGPPPKHGNPPPGPPDHRKAESGNDTGDPSLITCENGVAQAQEANKPDGGVVWWAPLGNFKPWTVKFDNQSVCAGANAQGVFTDDNEVCTVPGTASAGTYSYTVHLDGCAKDGTGKLTITGSAHQ
jgi:hypothetical protein